MSLRRTILLFTLAGTTILVAACDGDSTDDTVLEPSRESRIDTLAETVCERYGDTGAGCPGYGTGSGQKYQTESDCETDFRAKAADLWPANRCDGDRIDDSRFDACVDRAKSFACSTGGQNILDGVAALQECNADQVCIDPVN